MSETDEKVEPEILGIDDVEEVDESSEDNEPEIVGIEEPEEIPDDDQPAIISVDGPADEELGVEDAGDVEEIEEAADEVVDDVDEVEEVEEVEEPKRLRPPTGRRPSTQKRPRTTARGRRERTDRPGTQRMGTRRYARGGDQKAKLIVMAVTAGLLLILIVAAIAKATRKAPPPPKQKRIYIKHQLDRARAFKREGQALIREADKAGKAGSAQGKNQYLGQAMSKLRQAQAAYSGLIEQYKGPQYEYLHRESQETMKLLYHCQKSMTLSRR
jgi:hypothetical protein